MNKSNDKYFGHSLKDRKTGDAVAAVLPINSDNKNLAKNYSVFPIGILEYILQISTSPITSLVSAFDKLNEAYKSKNNLKKITLNDPHKSVQIGKFLNMASGELSTKLIFLNSSMKIISIDRTSNSISEFKKIFIQVQKEGKYIVYFNKSTDIFDVEISSDKNIVNIDNWNEKIESLVSNAAEALLDTQNELLLRDPTKIGVTSLNNNSKAFDRNIVTSYVNNFRRCIGGYLKPKVGFQTVAFPYENGTLIQMEFGINKQNIDTVKSFSINLKQALQKAEIELVSNKGKEIKSNFHGTNIIINENKIYFIKDLSKDEWSDHKTKTDVEKIITGLTLN